MKVTGTDPVARTMLTQEKGRSQAMPGQKSPVRGENCSPQDEQCRRWTPEMLEQAVQQANETLQTYNTSLQFKVHEQSGEYYCQVVNSETKDVIREVPPEWVLDLVAHFRQMVGLVVDEIV